MKELKFKIRCERIIRKLLRIIVPQLIENPNDYSFDKVSNRTKYYDYDFIKSILSLGIINKNKDPNTKEFSMRITNLDINEIIKKVISQKKNTVKLNIN